MPTTEKLKQEIADAEKKLAQERSRLQRLENRKSYYEKGDRQKRTPASSIVRKKGSCKIRS